MPRLLDLFCGAGGCSVGYARAGFDVTGVDIEPHLDYPFNFIQQDAMQILKDKKWLSEFDVIHASPPCHAYSTITSNKEMHPQLIDETRRKLQSWGGVFVIENVPNAPLIGPVLYCGEAFGLGISCSDGVYRPLKRHRLFESNVFLMSPGCACSNKPKIGVYGAGGGGVMVRRKGKHITYKGLRNEYGPALGIDWMTSRADLAQAIPPAYTHHIGSQLMEALGMAP